MSYVLYVISRYSKLVYIELLYCFVPTVRGKIRPKFSTPFYVKNGISRAILTPLVVIYGSQV